MAQDAKAKCRRYDLGNDLELIEVVIEDLREQDVNAHVMEGRKFDRLTANIKQRGAMESFPYCAQPGGTGPIEIVSGHHRVRAAKAAGLKTVWVLLDRALTTRSLITSKQLAHNFLVGSDDTDVVRQLLASIENPDDLIASGAPPDLLSDLTQQAMELFTPTIDLRFKTVSFTFLPHQLENLEKLLGTMDGTQDLVVAALEEQWEKFLKAVAKFGRFKKVLAGGMIISMLTDLALAQIAEHEAKEAANADSTKQAGALAAAGSAAAQGKCA